MTKSLFMGSIVAFMVPIAYQRIHFALKRHHFLVTPLRTRTGLQIHHGHWGLALMSGTGLWFVFGRENALGRQIASLAFMYGLGLLVDEIIPSLKMPSKDRELELRVYESAAGSTMILASLIVLALCILRQLS